MRRAEHREEFAVPHVQTDVAQFYYTLRLLDAQLEILTRTIGSYEEQVRLLGVQVRTGLTSPIVLNQAEAQLQQSKAQLAQAQLVSQNIAQAAAQGFRFSPILHTRLKPAS